MGSFVRNVYVLTLCPVVIRPYLCTSDSLSLRVVKSANNNDNNDNNNDIDDN